MGKVRPAAGLSSALLLVGTLLAASPTARAGGAPLTDQAVAYYEAREEEFTPEVMRQIERQVMRRVDAIVAANPRERAEMIWRYGVPAAKVATIGCGIDLALFRPQDRAAARAALELGPEPTLLFVGRIDPVKGIDFEVRPGEVFGLLGPNGAGKTTTVEILEGLRPRTAGDARRARTLVCARLRRRPGVQRTTKQRTP